MSPLALPVANLAAYGQQLHVVLDGMLELPHLLVDDGEVVQAGGLAPPKLDDVMATFKRDGYVVRVSRSPHPTRRAAAHLLMAQILADVIPHEALDALVSRSDYQAALHVAEGRGPHLDNGLPRK